MVCVKCGRESSHAVCGNCGYNHSSEKIVMLQDVVFEALLVSFQHPNMIFSGTALLVYNGNETSVHIPDGVTHIANFAFVHNSNLQEITIPGTVKRIMANAFSGCHSLETIHLNEGLEIIGKEAFSGKRKLREITLPGTVKEIGDGAFSGCDSLETIHLNEGLEIIGKEAFSHNRKLREITLPRTVKEISDGAFSCCYSLVDVTLPETLVCIGENAFERSGLESVVIPGSVRVIGKDSFRECEHLQTVFLNTGISAIEGGAFSGCQCLEHIHVPDTLEEINRRWGILDHHWTHAFDKSSRNPRKIYASDKWKKEHPELIKKILGQY